MAGLSLSGLASGVDTSSIVEQLMALDRQSLTKIGYRKSAVTGQQEALKERASPWRCSPAPASAGVDLRRSPRLVRLAALQGGGLGHPGQDDHRADANARLQRRTAGVTVELAVEIGRTQMTIRETLALGPGSIVTLNRLAGEPVDLLVNGTPITRGEIVVVDEEFGVRVTEVVSSETAAPDVAPADVPAAEPIAPQA